MKPRRPWIADDAGIALVVVLWLLTMLALIALPFAAGTRVEATVAINERANAVARALADAGIHRGIAALFITDEDEIWQFDGTVYELELAGGKIHVAIEDEAGKVDLNTAPDDLIRGLFARLGLDVDEADTAAAGLLDWRDEDTLTRPNGAEESQYRADDRPFLPRDGALLSLDEALQVMGVTPKTYEALMSAATIYTRLEGINPEVAPKAALLSLPGVNPTEVDDLLRVRAANKDADVKRPLPALTGVGDWLIDATGPVYTVRARGRSAGGAEFVREAVIWIAEDGRRPYWVLDWRIGRWIEPEPLDGEPLPAPDDDSGRDGSDDAPSGPEPEVVTG